MSCICGSLLSLVLLFTYLIYLTVCVEAMIYILGLEYIMSLVLRKDTGWAQLNDANHNANAFLGSTPER